MNQLSISVPNPIQPEQLNSLLSAAGQGPVLITTHNSPDPDALASGLALAKLLKESSGIPSRLVYSGLVSRAENRAVLRLLTPEWEYSDALHDIGAYSAVALIDSQPGAGNNSLPVDFLPDIVIDHHTPVRPETQQARFRDIRIGIGSTASILFQYLNAADVAVDSRLATALFYGLRADTNGLARDATTADGVIYSLLLSHLDSSLLHQVILSGLSQQYFSAFESGLRSAKITGQTITTYLGEIYRPDLVAEMADLLVRLENVNTALCLGWYDGSIFLSLRTGTPNEDAGLLLQDIITGHGKAGGHGTIAGGQIPLNGQDADELVQQVTGRFLEVMGETASSIPLLPEKDC